MTQREAVIVEAVRTAVGRKGGQLKDWHPVDLLAQMLSALVQRTKIDAGLVEDVIIGCVSQVGEQQERTRRVQPGESPSSRAGYCREPLQQPDCPSSCTERGRHFEHV